MDRAGEYADKALGRFMSEHQSLVGTHMTFAAGILHLSQFFHSEVEKAYKAGTADATRKESPVVVRREDGSPFREGETM